MAEKAKTPEPLTPVQLADRAQVLIDHANCVDMDPRGWAARKRVKDESERRWGELALKADILLLAMEQSPFPDRARRLEEVLAKADLKFGRPLLEPAVIESGTDLEPSVPTSPLWLDHDEFYEFGKVLIVNDPDLTPNQVKVRLDKAWKALNKELLATDEYDRICRYKPHRKPFMIDIDIHAAYHLNPDIRLLSWVGEATIHTVKLIFAELERRAAAEAAKSTAA